jgi:hypothetical protein
MEEISILGIVGYPAIVVFCLLIGMIAKNIKTIGDEWIPCICGIFGGALGALGMYIVPDFPASNYLAAIAIGIVSGFGATGVHQVYKQFSKKKEE